MKKLPLISNIFWPHKNGRTHRAKFHRQQKASRKWRMQRSSQCCHEIFHRIININPKLRLGSLLHLLSQMKSFSRLFSFWMVVVASLVTGSETRAADWSNSDFQYRYGSNFNDNGASGGQRIAKNLVEFQNSTGFGWGRSYFFLLMSKANDADGNSADLYSEGQVTLSLSKMFKHDLSWGPVKDLGITGGYNYGARNSAFRSNSRVLVYGGTVDLNVPYFNFLNVDVLAYRDAGNYGGYGGGFLCGRIATGYQITPYWQLPFSIGRARFMFDGYVDFIGAHGTCSSQILAEPQLKLDVGDLFGYRDKFFIGVELQYWRNKFGSAGVNETVPQVVVQWKL